MAEEVNAPPLTIEDKTYRMSNWKSILSVQYFLNQLFGPKESWPKTNEEWAIAHDLLLENRAQDKEQERLRREKKRNRYLKGINK